MTVLEKIANARVWRGCQIRLTKYNGRRAYVLLHASGAQAILYKKEAEMQTRDFTKLSRQRDNERRIDKLRRAGVRV